MEAKEIKSDAISDYAKYRGKCKEMSEALVDNDPSLRLVRGHYFDVFWGMQPHWWCEDKDGKIVDPTKDQFPTKGTGKYFEFDGWFKCEQCDERIHEDEAYIDGHHVFCSEKCFRRCVGL